MKQTNQLDFLQWVTKWPRQVLLVVLNIILTALLEPHSRANDGDQQLRSMSEMFLTELKEIRQVDGHEYLLVKRNESVAKLEAIVGVVLSHVTRETVDSQSFEWAMKMKYQFNEQTKNAFVQVRRTAATTDDHLCLSLLVSGQMHGLWL